MELLDDSLSGPLAAYAAGFATHLEERGYRPVTIAGYVHSMMQVSGWLKGHGLGAAAVDEQLIAVLVGERGTVGPVRGKRAGLPLLLGFLRSTRVAPPPVVVVSAMGVVLEEYRCYLVSERCLTGALDAYMKVASRFMAEACADDPERIASVSARNVATFLTSATAGVGRASANNTVSSLRSLLGWLYTTRRIDRPLAQGAAWLATRRSNGPPCGVDAAEITALLDTCDRDTLSGARAFAVLVVMCRLGLRAGEVAAMELTDLDWRRGELTVRGKGASIDRLPLPVDVGDALAGYLSHRGQRRETSRVFMLLRAPAGPMSMYDVRWVVRQAFERAGIKRAGSHRLRHGAAMAMLAGGAPLAEIGQVLRHRDVKTTAIYARVDLVTLAALARPWPETSR